MGRCLFQRRTCSRRSGCTTRAGFTTFTGFPDSSAAWPPSSSVQLQAKKLTDRGMNPNLLRKGKYRCTGDLRFDWCGFGPTIKSADGFIATKQLNPNQSSRGQLYCDTFPCVVSECSLLTYSIFDLFACPCISDLCTIGFFLYPHWYRAVIQTPGADVINSFWPIGCLVGLEIYWHFKQTLLKGGLVGLGKYPRSGL